MKKLKINMIVLAVGFTLNAHALTAELSAAQYAAAQSKIAVDSKVARAECVALTGNARDICLVDASGKERIAKADLEAKNLPSTETKVQAQIARAEAELVLAKQQCSIKTGNENTLCVQAAETAEATIKARAAEDLLAAAGAEPNPSPSRSDSNMRAADTLFDFDSANLRPAARASLNDFVGNSKENASARIVVVGYADRIGAEAYNQHLSELRVETVKDYLVGEGIQASRISTEGRGQTQPVTKAEECSGRQIAETIACLQPDRRVVVSMTGATSAR